MEYTLCITVEDDIILYDGLAADGPNAVPGAGDVIVEQMFNGVHAIRFVRGEGESWSFNDFSVTAVLGWPKTKDGLPVLETFHVGEAEIVVKDRLEESGTYKYTIRIDNGGPAPIASDPEIKNRRTVGPRKG